MKFKYNYVNEIEDGNVETCIPLFVKLAEEFSGRQYFDWIMQISDNEIIVSFKTKRDRKRYRARLLQFHAMCKNASVAKVFAEDASGELH